jgi:GlpG protein
MDPDPLRECSVCGASGPRSEMFGVEPDLLCARCASRVRRRMQVHLRPRGPMRAPVVTAGIVGLAAVLFLLDHVVYPNPTLRAGVGPAWWQTLYLNLQMGPRVWDGDVWTALGAAFLHGGWIHVIFDVWWIWELGRATEVGFGHVALILLVVGGAMVASGAEWLAGGSGIGLSGVVYALAFFLWVHHKTNAQAAAVMNRRTINILVVWFFLCIVLTAMGIWNIANWAHGGGALWGWAAGQALLHARRRILVPLMALATVAFVAALPFVTFGVQTRLRRLDAHMKAAGADERTRLVVWFNNR